MYRFWGKASASDSSYHLLVYHSLDVAACAQALLEKTPHLCQRIASLSGYPTENIQPFLVWLIRLHDIMGILRLATRSCVRAATTPLESLLLFAVRLSVVAALLAFSRLLSSRRSPLMKIEKPSPSPIKPVPTAAPTPAAPASAPSEPSPSSFEARTSKTVKRPPPTTPRAPAPPAGSASTPSGATEPPKGIADVLRNLMSGPKPSPSATPPPPASTPSSLVPRDNDQRAVCLAHPGSIGKPVGIATSDPAVLRDLQQRGAELLLDDEAFAGKMLDRFPDDRSYMAFQNNVIHAIEERIAKELAGQTFPDQDAASEAALDVAAQVKREARQNPDAFLP